MKFTADTLILAGMALAVLVLLCLLVSIWRGISARRALRHAQGQLQEREDELHTLVDTNQQLVQETHQRDVKLAALDVETSNLRQRLQDRENHIAQQAGDQHTLNASHSQLRDELARTSADSRGLAVELEHTRQQMQERLNELAKYRHGNRATYRKMG